MAWLHPVYREVTALRGPLGAVVADPTLGPGRGKHHMCPPAGPSEELMSFQERCFRGRMCAAEIKLGLCEHGDILFTVANTPR